MCNFHESVAVSAATDPLTGKIHAGHKAVIRIALSRYWASAYVDGAENVDGYSFYPLATAEQQNAFARSGLKRPLQDVKREEEAGIAFLRAKIGNLSTRQDLSAQALKLPIVTAREAFMNYAIDNFYKGEARDGLRFIGETECDDLKPLHAAVSALHGDAETSKVLERLVQGKICMLYSEAPQRASKALLNTYENLPARVKAVSASLAKYGGNILLGGFSGIVGHGIHYASVLGAGLAAGSASSMNLALSGVFLLASYGGWHKGFGGQYLATKEKVSAFAVQAALTFAVAVGAQQMLSHDHMSSEKALWFSSLPEAMRSGMLQQAKVTYNSLPLDLRTRLDEAAAKEDIPPEVFILTCSGIDPVSQEITAFLTEKRGAVLGEYNSAAPNL